MQDVEGTLDPKDLLTPEELAERLKVPKSWVFEQTRQRAKARQKNPLPCIRLGKYLRFSWVKVSAWMGGPARDPDAANGSWEVPARSAAGAKERSTRTGNV